MHDCVSSSEGLRRRQQQGGRGGTAHCLWLPLTLRRRSSFSTVQHGGFRGSGHSAAESPAGATTRSKRRATAANQRNASLSRTLTLVGWVGGPLIPPLV